MCAFPTLYNNYYILALFGQEGGEGREGVGGRGGGGARGDEQRGSEGVGGGMFMCAFPALLPNILASFVLPGSAIGLGVLEIALSKESVRCRSSGRLFHIPVCWVRYIMPTRTKYK